MDIETYANRPPSHTAQATADRVMAIRKAAVAFANDYGPLAAANSGDEEAQHAVALKLFNALKGVGVHMIHTPNETD